MKKTKMEKGITLLALIITIVVLLILASVTIGAIKNSSIITHSQDTKKQYTEAEIEEKLQLAVLENYLANNGKINLDELEEKLESDFGDNIKIEDGTIIITNGNNEYSYEISENGTITEISQDTRTPEEIELALKKIIFGEDLNGRILNEILTLPSDGNGLEVPIFDEDTGITYITSSFDDALKDYGILYSYYLQYNNEIYKFKLLEDWDVDEDGEEDDEGTITSIASEGLTKIEAEGENVGKTVWYDGKKWTILYNDTTNGLQMICNDVYGYNNDGLTGENYFSPDDRFYLGTIDSSIKNWDSLITEADLNEDKKLNEFEKAVYSYNNAITTLNTACDSVVSANKNIISVRCVGSNPISKNSEGALYTSVFISNWIANNPSYVNDKTTGIGKNTDYNYVSDFERMVALGINNITTEKSDYYGYWLASRIISEDSAKFFEGDSSRYSLRFVDEYAQCTDTYYPVAIFNGGDDSDYNANYLRPVITLNSFDCLTSDTSHGTNYVLE